MIRKPWTCFLCKLEVGGYFIWILTPQGTERLYVCAHCLDACRKASRIAKANGEEMVVEWET